MALKNLFLKQKMMRTVLFALIPIMIFSVLNFGWRVLCLYIFNIVIACLVEYLSQAKLYKNKKISEAAIVSAILYTMTLPASIPFWISAVGIIFAMFFGKAVFGGFGKNVFNPALVGRVFIYVNFPQPLTISWNQNSFPAISNWLTPVIDDVSMATPMLMFKNGNELASISDLFFGLVPGSIGETSKLLIILGGIYLIVKKVASWEIMVSSLIGFTGLSLILRMMGFDSVLPPFYGILSGGFLFGTVFMATDPISAPKTKIAKWCYGIIIGVVTVIIRGFALFSGGMMFAILIGNTFGPIIDYAVRKSQQAKKAKQRRWQHE
ncbi:RnfABCDGE type electron transport complex subunit D [Anaerococcus sp. AGMB09787]|uniref:RnfABCDGE type electron transport complex subunit D n=1 Tax=Anaerococcus sp. AGMB09787 TaxID=2922869 RepID=UPI001FAF73C6|nr:RnfABCDGE type electron transport complex subunit D [Anaerococcus sp. AGMB09787]